MAISDHRPRESVFSVMVTEYAPQIVAAGYFGFFAVLFLQSGFDKLLDRKGNLEWMEPHFANSPFKGKVPALLTVLTLMELATCIMSFISIVLVFLGTGYDAITITIALILATLLSLFTGQRFAKDYVGAATIVAYFAVALIGAVWFVGTYGPTVTHSR